MSNRFCGYRARPSTTEFARNRQVPPALRKCSTRTEKYRERRDPPDSQHHDHDPHGSHACLRALSRYKADTPDGRKRALLANACLALEVHAQLEEEIFYPALRRVISDDQVLNKSGPEHDEMRERSARCAISWRRRITFQL